MLNLEFFGCNNFKWILVDVEEPLIHISQNFLALEKEEKNMIFTLTGERLGPIDMCTLRAF